MITKTHCMQKLTRLKDQDTPSLNGWETFFELGQNTCNYVWLIIIGSLPQKKKIIITIIIIIIGSQEQLIKINHVSKSY